jgi:hypothetical protein
LYLGGRCGPALKSFLLLLRQFEEPLALRRRGFGDFEILQRQKGTWAGIVVYTGSYPGFKDEDRAGIAFHKLGFGLSYLVLRLTFTFFANLRVLFDRVDAIGNSISAYAPLLAGLLRPGRFYLVARHCVGARSREKYSLMGTAAWMCEWLLFRFQCRH